jgi:hypothetical protein
MSRSAVRRRRAAGLANTPDCALAYLGAEIGNQSV